MKFFFCKPQKKKVLIFDRESVNNFFLKLFKKNDYEILDVRYESINIYVIFTVILKTGFSNIKKNYIIQYINLVSPKIVVTFIDNNLFFYELKKYHPNAKYISIQNGRRDKVFFENLKKNNKKKFFADYIFVFGYSIKKKISKFIKGNIIVLGSLKNNFFKKKKYKKTNSIIYISQIKLGRKVELTNLGEVNILNLLKKFCEKNHLSLKIFLKDDYHNNIQFQNFMNKNLPIIKKIKILKRKENFYELLDNYDFFVVQDSTLGYEMLARKKKVIFLPSINLSNFKLIPFTEFGFPKYLKSNGPFWCNYFQEKRIIKIIENVLRMKKKNWDILIKEFIHDHLIFCPGNKVLKRVIARSIKGIYS